MVIEVEDDVLKSELTDEERKIAEEREIKWKNRDDLIKHVFDNLRNLIICVSLAFGGVAITEYQDALPFNPEFNSFLGGAVVILSFVLCVWNMIHGAEKLLRPIAGTKIALIFSPLACFYMVAMIIVFQASVLAKT